jgi:hypothetical protein
MPSDDDLRTEAIAFGRYLVDATPSDELVERYRRANDVLLDETPSPADQRVIAYARENPWAIRLLDAGTALSGRAPIFRKKLLIMMAIVETTPELAEQTEPRSEPMPTLVAKLGVAGVKMVTSAALGLALSTVIASKRRD